MSRETLFTTICSTLLCLSCLSFADSPSDLISKQADQKTEPSKEATASKNEPLRIARPMRVSLRHIEGGGVGYNRGYTTLEGFFSLISDNRSIVPFVDLRGHVFDDGKLAANAGFGIRALADCRVYGANAYYDYRNTKRQHYNQIALGFETMGVRWDFRLNGYLPVGDKKSHPYDKQESTNLSFDSFRVNNAYVKQTTHKISKIQYAMKGLDAEAAFHFSKDKNYDFYAAVGPYYYNYNGKQAIGGRVRLAAQIYENLSLEIINSYDSRFHENFQGKIGITIPFGPRQTPSKNKRLKNCNDSYLLSQRLVQDVERQEIVVVDRFRKKEFNESVSLAIDPTTGNPFFFVFVDNTSHSNGTFESPYSMLLTAQIMSSPNDAIYVYPGDGTTNGMALGISLQDNQKLFGAGTAQTLSTTLGMLTIPAQASSMPLITNTIGSIVTVANNNEISGINFLNTSDNSAISCNNISNALIHNNYLDGSNSFSPSNILLLLNSCSGLISVIDNTFDFVSSGGGFAINFTGTSPGTDYVIASNQFLAQIGSHSSGIEIGNGQASISFGDFNSITISNNQFNGLSQKAVGGFGFGGTGNLLVDQNSFSNVNNYTLGVLYLPINSNGNLSIQVTNNSWVNPPPTSTSCYIGNFSSTSKACVRFSGNVSDLPISHNSYIFNNSIGGQFTLDYGNNTGTASQLNVTPGTCP